LSESVYYFPVLIDHYPRRSSLASWNIRAMYSAPGFYQPLEISTEPGIDASVRVEGLVEPDVDRF